jgi:hypothetical protein
MNRLGRSPKERETVDGSAELSISGLDVLEELDEVS